MAHVQRIGARAQWGPTAPPHPASHSPFATHTLTAVSAPQDKMNTKDPNRVGGVTNTLLSSGGLGTSIAKSDASYSLSRTHARLGNQDRCAPRHAPAHAALRRAEHVARAPAAAAAAARWKRRSRPSPSCPPAWASPITWRSAPRSSTS